MKKEHMAKTELEKRLEAEAAAEAATSPDSAEPEAQAVPVADEALAAATAERDAYKDQLLRLRAEFDNYRKRMAKENERVRQTAAESLIRDLLPAVDNLERALAHAGSNGDGAGLAEGVGMIQKQLCDTLARHGLAPIPAMGEPFDPAVHEALACLPSADVPPNHVCQEFQKGYRLGGHVLRPSQVAVSSAPPQPEADDVDGETSDEQE